MSGLHFYFKSITIITIMNNNNLPKLLGVAHLNEKCQLVIPKEAREFLGIGPGDRVLITTAPFFKAIVIARPEDFEAQLQSMMSDTAETIGDMKKELKK
jgi:AbrB family looped-hinge helix DNA binding protein